VGIVSGRHDCQQSRREFSLPGLVNRARSIHVYADTHELEPKSET
jgi:hypothetical protein